MSATYVTNTLEYLSGKQVLLTGGTGFVGRHLLPELLASGAVVTCLTRASSDTSRLPKDVTVVQADLSTGEGLAEALDGKDVVIHMAALLFGVGWQEYLRANALAALRLAEAFARKQGNTRFILLSSLAATGPCAVPPGASEASTPAPVSAYGWSKLLVEQILGHTLGDRLVILRPPIIYGSGDKGLLPVFRGVKHNIAVSPGWGRDFPISVIHVGDMVRAVLCACHPKACGVYHLNDGQMHTMASFCKAMGNAVAHVLGRDAQTVRVLHIPLPIMAVTAVLSTAYGLAADILCRRLSGHGLRRAPGWNVDKYREARQEGWLSEGSRICHELGFMPYVTLEDGLLEAAQGYVREGLL
ncbi:MAG: NAD(P)-dependent oxidoreductase [Desulfovibrio sp.]|nr:NAD(P)-dependent oxidoreductase [Desulfovibrio sp.]